MTAPKWEAVDSDASDLLRLVAEGSLALGADAEWQEYLMALLSVADDTGLISQNDLRAHLRTIAPARRGAFMHRAKVQRIVIDTGRSDVNDDAQSRNRGKPQRLVRLTIHGYAVAAAAVRGLGVTA
jgi:hypothetical protein